MSQPQQQQQQNTDDDDLILSGVRFGQTRISQGSPFDTSTPMDVDQDRFRNITSRKPRVAMPTGSSAVSGSLDDTISDIQRDVWRMLNFIHKKALMISARRRS